MAPTTALSAAARVLLASVDREPAYLHDPMQQMFRDAREAIPSFLGFELALIVGDQAFHLDHWEPSARAADIATSLWLSANALLTSKDEGHVILWAGNPGALVDLAADITFALELPEDVIVLDGHLTPVLREPARGEIELQEASRINQAIGLLIADGHPPTHARRHLEKTAEDLGRRLHVHATMMLNEQRTSDPLARP